MSALNEFYKGPLRAVKKITYIYIKKITYIYIKNIFFSLYLTNFFLVMK